MIEYMKSMFSNRCTNSSLELKIGKNIIPQIVIRCTIEKITRDFLWSGALDVSHDHLVSCCHKKEYGLSLGNVVYNIVLVAKWLWCFPLELYSLSHKMIFRVSMALVGTGGMLIQPPKLLILSLRNSFVKVIYCR